MTSEQLPSPAPEVIRQQLADGTVLFHPVTEIYYGLNEVGGRIWELLPPASASLTDLLNEVCRNYPDVDRSVISEDVEELLADLREQGLVRDNATGAANPDAGADDRS